MRIFLFARWSFFIKYLPERKSSLHGEVDKIITSSHLANLADLAWPWNNKTGWPGYRVNANNYSSLFVVELTELAS